MVLTNLQRVRKLYKTILKLHRGLPPELEVLGSNYVREEFKRHKNCNVEETKVFMNEWSEYAISLAKQLGVRGPKTSTGVFGRQLSAVELEQLREEQVHQLYELMMAAAGQEGSNKT